MPLERIFSSLNISSTGLSSQRKRMDQIAQNIANAETTRTEEGGPYRRKYIVTAEAPVTVFPKHFENEIQLQRTTKHHFKDEPIRGDKPVPSGTEVAEVALDMTPPRMVYDPAHPDADAQGYVAMPNVNVLTEMVDLIASTRAYEANVTALNASKDMTKKALEI